MYNKSGQMEGLWI